MKAHGYYRIDHKDFWGIVWGGIAYQTPQKVEAKWQALFSDKVETREATKKEVDGYKVNFEVIDLEEEK